MELTKDLILKQTDLTKEKVDVPEWGGYVYVKELTASERDAFEAAITTMVQNGQQENVEVNRKNMRAKLLARTLCDHKGEKLFKPRDVSELGNLSAKAMDRCFAVATRINGITKEDQEELVKN